MRDFDKSKSANLLKILKVEHLTKKWQNCGTEALCVMLYYDGKNLARIVNKVLGIHVLCVFFYFETVVVLVLLTVLYFHKLNFPVCMFCFK